MTNCIRSCLIRRRHLPTCPADDHTDGAWLPADLDDTQIEQLSDGDNPAGRRDYWIGPYGGLEVWHPCPGCRPRDARHGVLCETCHNRIVGWLSGPHSLVWAYSWLTANLTPSVTGRTRQDWQRPGSDDGPAAPIRVTILDLRTLLSDRVYIAEERTREVFDRPDIGTFDLAKGCAFLHAWLTKIETDPDMTVWLYDKFDETMRDVANLVPWRDRPRKIIGVPCPECETEALADHGGDDDVTCRSCSAVISRARYDTWTRMLVEAS